MPESNDEHLEAFLNSEIFDDDFMNSIVEEKLKVDRQKFKIRLIVLSPATGANENFVSVILRAKIKIEFHDTKERKSVDVCLKVLLSKLEELQQVSIFAREKFIYEEVITKFENLWMERANETVKFAPKCLISVTDPYEVMVLDDLKAENYEMLDKNVGLSAAQTKLGLTKLAQFHAAGAVVYQENGTLQDFLIRKIALSSFATGDSSVYIRSIIHTLNNFLRCIRAYGDCDSYADKIAKMDMNSLLFSSIAIADPMRCGQVFLAHGDLWVNNMMFKLNHVDEPEDVLMLDFQLCAWSGPSLDLIWLISSSVHDNVKIKYFDEFIEHYHEELVKSLKKLKYDQNIPTLEDIHEDLKKNSFFFIRCLLFIVFITKYESNEEFDVKDVLFKADSLSNEVYDKIFSNETYKKAVKLWLPFLDERGYLDG